MYAVRRLIYVSFHYERVVGIFLRYPRYRAVLWESKDNSLENDQDFRYEKCLE